MVDGVLPYSETGRYAVVLRITVHDLGVAHERVSGGRFKHEASTNVDVGVRPGYVSRPSQREKPRLSVTS